MFIKFICAAVAVVGITSQAMSFDPYIEGQIGTVGLSDVDTKSFSGTTGGVTFTNVKGTLAFNNSLVVGAEAGIKEIGKSNFRLGLGYNRFTAKVDSLTVSSGTTSASTSDPALLKALETDVGLFTANAYYDFISKSRLTPYVGIGVGLADIQGTKDNEFALSLAAGLNFDLTEKTYLGVKGNYYRVAGPTNTAGLEYDTIKAYSLMATLGYRF
jgi:opacity protein-like surface antigen